MQVLENIRKAYLNTKWGGASSLKFTHKHISSCKEFKFLNAKIILSGKTVTSSWRNPADTT